MKRIYFMLGAFAVLINAFALDRMSFADMVPTSDPYDVVVRLGVWNADKTVFTDYEVINFAGTGDKDKDQQELIRRLDEMGSIDYYDGQGCTYGYSVGGNYIKEGQMESPEDCDEYQVYIIDVSRAFSGDAACEYE